MNLYWLETDDHHKDWFVLARSKPAAEKFFESYEGYGRGDAMAQFVLKNPDAGVAKADWATLELLEQCGFKVLKRTSPRVLEYQGRPFTEGLLDEEICRMADDQFEAAGEGRPNNTSRKTDIS